MLVNCEVRLLEDPPRVAVATLKGGIDPAAIAHLTASLARSEGKGVRVLIMDLGELRYINSASMASLVNLGDVLTERRGHLVLAGPQPKVKVILGLMGMSQLFRQYKTVESAIEGVLTARRGAKPAHA